MGTESCSIVQFTGVTVMHNTLVLFHWRHVAGTKVHKSVIKKGVGGVRSIVLTSAPVSPLECAFSCASAQHVSIRFLRRLKHALLQHSHYYGSSVGPQGQGVGSRSQGLSLGNLALGTRLSQVCREWSAKGKMAYSVSRFLKLSGGRMPSDPPTETDLRSIFIHHNQR